MLIIWELANNHDGDIIKACDIVDALSSIKKEYKHLDFAIKLQRRNIDTFIHPDYKNRYEVSYIKRFSETALSDYDFLKLCGYIKFKNFKLGITPFDEESVEFIKQCHVDFVKVASCCANEWGLLEEIAKLNKPIIASTAGLDWSEVDNLYNFLLHKESAFSLLHCCAIYPAPIEDMNLNVIDKMKRRYKVPIGFSDHSRIGTMEAARISVAKGATILERHIKMGEGNDYSINMEEATIYCEFINNVLHYCGNDRKEISEKEKNSLRTLKRGVWANRYIDKESEINHEDVFFAFPNLPNQLLSDEFGTYQQKMWASVNYPANSPIHINNYKSDNHAIQVIRKYIHEAKSILAEAGIVLNKRCTAEISHHYGIDGLWEFGALIVDSINRQYCQKYIVMTPNQKYVNHTHHEKEETFKVLFGVLYVKLENNIHKLHIGDDILIERYRAHEFWVGEEGCVFEEISTTHVIGDSYYTDTEVYKLDPIERKTKVDKL